MKQPNNVHIGDEDMTSANSLTAGWYEASHDSLQAWFHDGSDWSGWQYVDGELLFQDDPAVQHPPSTVTLVRRRAPLGDIVVGDVVRHPTFGLGVVIDTHGTGKKMEAAVKFADVGMKNLALAWAKLDKVA